MIEYSKPIPQLPDFASDKLPSSHLAPAQPPHHGVYVLLLYQFPFHQLFHCHIVPVPQGELLIKFQPQPDHQLKALAQPPLQPPNAINVPKIELYQLDHADNKGESSPSHQLPTVILIT
ncbi:TPA: hypothetical protein DEG21_02925 [Patescibacteria group bacterium]|nr:hypothetical protein [Candidatus Gracilibacteria bacterium]HBY74824.1 hypothetical protein [Candidatus Gracilibacteria bacterium]